MLRNLFNRLAQDKRHEVRALSDSLPTEAADGAPVIFKRNVDGMAKDKRREFFAKAAEATDIPLFEGRVEHAYDMADVADVSQCPRCGSKTRQEYANFIYATQIAPRVMFAPAGHFCAKCPCVVIDQDLIEAGVSDPRFQYQGVLGIDYGENREPDLFRTWNGEDAIHVFDEDQKPLGIGTFSPARPARHLPPPSAKNRKTKRKRQEKAARRAGRMKRKR